MSYNKEKKRKQKQYFDKVTEIMYKRGYRLYCRYNLNSDKYEPICTYVPIREDCFKAWVDVRKGRYFRIYYIVHSNPDIYLDTNWRTNVQDNIWFENVRDKMEQLINKLK